VPPPTSVARLGSASGTRRGRPGYDLETLLAVVVDVFNERGFDGTSIEELSRRLGVSKAAIYHHVASKDELLERALDRALVGLEDMLEQTRRAPGPAIERLEALVRGSVFVLHAQLPYVTLLLRVRGNSEVERAALDRRRRIDRYVASLVREAMADGDLRTDVDPSVAAHLIYGTVNSLTEWYRPTSRRTPSELADAVCAMAFDGLRVRPHPAR
jgi:AcrR family transcriptional regulator